MEPDFLFVGDRPSLKAKAMGVTWEDGRLAAKQLFDALEANGIDPKKQLYINWFADDFRHRRRRRGVEQFVRSWYGVVTIVALGSIVSAALTVRGISHLKLIHPAARGKIRKKQRYIAHVKKVLVQSSEGETLVDSTLRRR